LGIALAVGLRVCFGRWVVRIDWAGSCLYHSCLGAERLAVGVGAQSDAFGEISGEHQKKRNVPLG